MTIKAYDVTANAAQTHTVARRSLPGARVEITFNDQGTATETLIIDGNTWTMVASGATGRQWNIGASTAEDTATNFQSAFDAHADSSTYTVTRSGAVVTLEKTSPTASLANVTGTYNATPAFLSPRVPSAATEGMTLAFDDSVFDTPAKVRDALEVLNDMIRREIHDSNLPTGWATSGSETL